MVALGMHLFHSGRELGSVAERAPADSAEVEPGELINSAAAAGRQLQRRAG